MVNETPVDPALRWRESLNAWGVPESILAAAPRSPWGFAVATFERAADEALTRSSPTSDRLGEALPEHGSVLDVGCGAGAGSLPVADRAGLLIGVDESADMLEAFAARAAAAGVDAETVAGRWPDIADVVGIADVAVCRNVAYNVADLDTFAVALTEHTRHRVVLELTARHPLAWMNPLWQAVHGLSRPERPTADDAVAVLVQAGLDVSVITWDTPWLLASEPPDQVVDFVLRRLCVGDDRRDEVEALLHSHPVPATQPAATLWWAGGA